MKITELRELGFDCGDYVIITETKKDKFSKDYLRFYVGKIRKNDNDYYLDGYYMETRKQLYFQNQGSQYWMSSEDWLATILQPSFQRIHHIYPTAIVRTDAKFVQTLQKKMQNVSSWVFDSFNKELPNGVEVPENFF